MSATEVTDRTMRTFSIVALVLWLVSGYSPSAQAHPHAWISLKTVVYVNEKGEAVAVREYWQFDKMYSAMATKKFGSNADPAALKKALLRLSENNLTNLRDDHYYTTIKDDDGNIIALGEPKDIGGAFVGVVESSDEKADQKKMIDNMVAQTANYPPAAQKEAQAEVQKYIDAANAKTQVEMEFTLPLKVPYDLRDHSISYRIYDPTYYTDVEHLPEGAVMFVSAKDGSPLSGCEATVDLPKIDADMLLNASALDTNPGSVPQDLGYSFSEKVTLSCSQQKL